MRKQQNFLNRDEQGFASLVIALTMILVLALITVGFAQLTRREQQNALNKQLATQANYAAESGINDAVTYITAHPDPADSAYQTPDQCLAYDTDHALTGYKKQINTSIGASYSCLMINTKPTSLRFDDVSPQAGDAESFTTSVPPDPLTVEWESDRPISSVPAGTGGGFKAQAALPAWTGATNDKWNAPAVLQFSITPLGNGAVDRATLSDGMFTVYLYPTTSGSGTVTYAPNTNPGAQGQVIGGICATNGSGSRCRANITGLPAAAGGYLIHFINYYNTSTVTVSSTTGGSLVRFIGGQALIDSTGRARDVLKRLQVRIDLDPSMNAPPALQAGSICKRQLLLPGSTAYASYPSPLPPDPCDLDT